MKNLDHTNRIAAGLLLLALCAQTAACGESAAETTDTEPTDLQETAAVTETVTETVFETDHLPDTLDFGGKTVTVHVRADDDTIKEMYAESENGDTVNDAVFRRNLEVEERLNISLNTVYNDGWANYGKTLTLLNSTIAAGDPAYDIIAGWSAQIPSLVLKGCFMNLLDMDYLDFSRVWWNQSVVESSTINDRIYLATGDIAMSLLNSTYVVFFNKEMTQERDINDLYSVTFDGKWTIDRLSALSKDVYTDLNGDGKHDPDDRYGYYAIYGTNPDDGFMASTLIRMLRQDGKGNYVLNTDISRVTMLAEKLYSMYFENEGVYASPINEFPDGDLQGATMFSENRAMFIMDYLGAISDYGLNNMKADFGILPYPKMDEAQETYGSFVQNAVSLWGIPVSAADPSMSAAVMEALASGGYRHITPAFYETALKVKYSRDNETVQMLDLIKESGQLDFEIIYNESIGSIRYIMRELMIKKNKDVASYYQKKQNSYQKALDKLIGYFNELDS